MAKIIEYNKVFKELRLKKFTFLSCAVPYILHYCAITLFLKLSTISVGKLNVLKAILYSFKNHFF